LKLFSEQKKICIIGNAKLWTNVQRCVIKITGFMNKIFKGAELRALSALYGMSWHSFSWKGFGE
jgi:hypothetical protein